MTIGTGIGDEQPGAARRRNGRRGSGDGVGGPAGAAVEAVTYVALRTREGLRPTREYLGHLLAGRDLLPRDYVERLMATPTLD